jgi:hypothetical protein
MYVYIYMYNDCLVYGHPSHSHNGHANIMPMSIFFVHHFLGVLSCAILGYVSRLVTGQLLCALGLLGDSTSGQITIIQT